MSHLEIDVARLAAGKLADFAAGTLVMVPSQTQSAPGPFWALCFDKNSDAGVKRNVIWLNGTPWRSDDPPFLGLPLEDAHLEGVGCGLAHILVDLTSGAGRKAREMRWEQSAGSVAVGAQGTFLVGWTQPHAAMFGAYYAIDVSAWVEAPDVSRDAPVEWFSRWSVMIETSRGDIALPFDASSRNAALIASTR